MKPKNKLSYFLIKYMPNVLVYTLKTIMFILKPFPDICFDSTKSDTEGDENCSICGEVICMSESNFQILNFSKMTHNAFHLNCIINPGDKINHSKSIIFKWIEICCDHCGESLGGGELPFNTDSYIFEKGIYHKECFEKIKKRFNKKIERDDDIIAELI